MKIKKSSAVAFILAAIVITIAWKQSSYNRCSGHMIEIADKICEFRHETGRWPYTEKEILENPEILDGAEFKTLYGKSISYDPGDLSLHSECPHGKWSAHGFNFEARYEKIYQ